MPARHPRDGRGNSLSKRGGTRNRPAFRRNKPRLYPLRTHGRIWKTGCPCFTSRPAAPDPVSDLLSCPQVSLGGGTRNEQKELFFESPMSALLAFLSGFPKTVQRVLFALAARLPSAANSTASQALFRNRPGPFRVVFCPLLHDQPEERKRCQPPNLGKMPASPFLVAGTFSRLTAPFLRGVCCPLRRSFLLVTSIDNPALHILFRPWLRHRSPSLLICPRALCAS